MLAKLYHYGIRGFANEWFRKQFVSINSHVSNKFSIKYGVPQGSVLEPLLVLIYINNLNHAINFCEVHPFAEGTNLGVMLTKSYLIFKLTELVIFKHQKKKLECPIKIKLKRKGLYPSKSVRHLAVKTDDNLKWKNQTYNIAKKLNRANVLFCIIRNYVSFSTLKVIYFAIFDSRINYAKLIWGQNPNAKLRIIILQKKP